MSAIDLEERVPIKEALEGDFAAGDSLERERERFAVLYRVGRTVLSASSADDLYDLALTVVFDCMNAERGALLLRDAAGEMSPKVLRHRDRTALTDDELSVPTSIVRETVEGQVGILTTDAVHDPRFLSRASIQRGHIRSALCAPLWDGENVLGVIYLDSRLKSYAFTREDLLLLSGIANLIAIRLKQESLNAALGEERVVRSNLERYHSPDVVEAILAGHRERGRPDIGLEERDVTILFADLKGFTTLAESVPPSVLADFLNEYYGLVTRIVFEHGGSVNEYVGDSVMAIFGAPVVQADHALRAVRAAIELQRQLQSPPVPPPAPLRGAEARIAVNTGSVVVGSVGPAHRLKYAVVGDPVNVAARLEHLGEPNTITLGEETYRRLGGEISCLDLGPTQLRGREQPIRAYRVDV